MICHGKKTIQDYIPRSFAISFGFFCGRAEGNSLKDLTYTISIYDQTNEIQESPPAGNRKRHTARCITGPSVTYSGEGGGEQTDIPKYKYYLPSYSVHGR